MVKKPGYKKVKKQMKQKLKYKPKNKYKPKRKYKKRKTISKEKKLKIASLENRSDDLYKELKLKYTSTLFKLKRISKIDKTLLSIINSIDY